MLFFLCQTCCEKVAPIFLLFLARLPSQKDKIGKTAQIRLANRFQTHNERQTKMDIWFPHPIFLLRMQPFLHLKTCLHSLSDLGNQEPHVVDRMTWWIMNLIGDSLALSCLMLNLFYLTKPVNRGLVASWFRLCVGQRSNYWTCITQPAPRNTTGINFVKSCLKLDAVTESPIRPNFELKAIKTHTPLLPCLEWVSIQKWKLITNSATLLCYKEIRTQLPPQWKIYIRLW